MLEWGSGWGCGSGVRTGARAGDGAGDGAGAGAGAGARAVAGTRARSGTGVGVVGCTIRSKRSAAGWSAAATRTMTLPVKVIDIGEGGMVVGSSRW